MIHVVVSDPPWKFGDSLPGDTRGASKQYSCMSVSDICAMRPPYHDQPDSVLFLWRVSSMVEEAYHVIRAWGYVPKTELVWEKLTSKGKPHFGMGRYVRASHETCVIAARGKAFPSNRGVRSRFSAKAGVHSRKPPEFFAIVESMYPASPKAEMFARAIRSGWEQSGMELGKLEAAV